MDRWKSRGGKSQREEEMKREDQRRERAREKVEKSRNTVFFRWFVASEGAAIWPDERWKIARIGKSKCTKHSKFGVLLEVEMSKKCTPLWRETHFQGKIYKTHQGRSTFWSWDVEKVHIVVARSTFRSQKWEKLRVRSTFGRSDVDLRGRHKGFCTLPKASKTWGFCSSFNYNDDDDDDDDDDDVMMMMMIMMVMVMMMMWWCDDVMMWWWSWWWCSLSWWRCKQNK